MRSHAYAEMCEDANFRICGIISAYPNMKTQLYAEKYAIYGFCNICDRMCDRMFSYNRYPYNCASVQRALLAPEILNESFQKCRYFTALYVSSVLTFNRSNPVVQWHIHTQLLVIFNVYICGCLWSISSASHFIIVITWSPSWFSPE